MTVSGMVAISFLLIMVGLIIWGVRGNRKSVDDSFGRNHHGSWSDGGGGSGSAD